MQLNISMKDVHVPTSRVAPTLKETIDLRHVATFLLASKQAHLIWIVSLVEQEKGKGVNGMFPTADIIAQE